MHDACIYTGDIWITTDKQPHLPSCRLALRCSSVYTWRSTWFKKRKNSAWGGTPSNAVVIEVGCLLELTLEIWWSIEILSQSGMELRPKWMCIDYQKIGKSEKTHIICSVWLMQPFSVLTFWSVGAWVTVPRISCLPVVLIGTTLFSRTSLWVYDPSQPWLINFPRTFLAIRWILWHAIARHYKYSMKIDFRYITLECAFLLNFKPFVRRVC